ncbi:merR family regulatory protein [Ditylenchus destructor]|nr:merR family regulatory protein [Ditylenchus destructor]
MSSITKPKIAISACLLGENVRFNGGHKQSLLCSQTLADYFDFVPLCPEVAIGLGIPREPIRLVGDPAHPQAVGTVNRELNVTQPLDDYGQQMAAEHTDLCGYIFMQKSPSCGLERVKVYAKMALRWTAAGAVSTPRPFVPAIPICRWKKTLAATAGRRPDPSPPAGLSFALQILVDGPQSGALQKPRPPAGQHDQGRQLDELASGYFSELMTGLTKCATRGTHTNVLQHISGYLKQAISADDKQEMQTVIGQYRHGIVPLVVPMTLLKHHFRQHPDRYIAQQAYLQPPPGKPQPAKCDLDHESCPARRTGEDFAQALEDGWLPIREVARQTGVNAVTLRAWERRYGLIVPQRTPRGIGCSAPSIQVKGLIDSAQAIPDAVENEWHSLRQNLVQAISELTERRVDDAFNQAMALYPPRTLCEQLLLPLLQELEQRWQGQFGAQMERVFFLSWLRSKFGARIYHNNRQLHGAPLLLVNQSDLPLEPHLWLSAWLASSADCPVEVFDWPLPAGELALAVEHLQPRAVLLYSSKSLHLSAFAKLLSGVSCPKLIVGPTVCIHQAELSVLTHDLPELFVAKIRCRLTNC